MSQSCNIPQCSSVSPYLIVDGADRTIEFLQAVFEAELVCRYLDAHGNVMHAEVRIADAIIMLTDNDSRWPPIPAGVHIYVPDVDVIYQRALDAGATSLQAPVHKSDTAKRGGVQDSGGTTWWIATKGVW